MVLEPHLDVSLFKLVHRQRAAELAQVIDNPLRPITVAFAQGCIRDSPFAVLEILRTDFGDNPLLGRSRWRLRLPALPEFDAGQRKLRRLLVVHSPDTVAVLVEQGHSLFAARERVVPGIGLVPVPGGAVRLPALFFSPRAPFRNTIG